MGNIHKLNDHKNIILFSIIYVIVILYLVSVKEKMYSIKNEIRISKEIFRKSSTTKNYFSLISVINDILTAIGHRKSNYSLDYSNIDMNIINIIFNFILDQLNYIFNIIICNSRYSYYYR